MALVTSGSKARARTEALIVTDPVGSPPAATGPSGDGNAAHWLEPTPGAVWTAVAERPGETASVSGLLGAFNAVGLSNGIRSKAIGSVADAPTVNVLTWVGISQAGIRELLPEQVDEGCGLLAHLDDEPVGWCSLAPRRDYTHLPRRDPATRRLPPRCGRGSVR